MLNSSELTPMLQNISSNAEQQETPGGATAQEAVIYDELVRCLAIMKTSKSPSSGLYCPMVWDGAFCWPFVPAGNAHVVPCPSYIHGFDIRENASRTCTEQGTWWVNDSTNASWSNYTMCKVPWYEQDEYGLHLATIKQIAKVGYTLSLGTLLVAFFILASFRRLRCPRNNLHLHLFFSFVMRALMSIMKDMLYGVGEQRGVGCKIFTSFWQYFLMANYAWILMEGLYLHNLIFLAMFSDTTGIIRYVLAGWGLPVLFVVPWVIVRAILEDLLCWTTNDHPGYFWIIRGPITASIVVNFVLFVNITRVLFLKMFAAHAPQVRHYRYRKWFKSTLVLVPLFGVHYTFLLGMSLAAVSNSLLEVIWLYVDQLFSSSQGAVVAFLYCFLNGEVQSELRKACQRWKLGNTNEHVNNSVYTQSLTLMSRTGRCSLQSLPSAQDGGKNSGEMVVYSPNQHPPDTPLLIDQRH